MSHSQTQTPYCYNHLIVMYKNEILVVWLLKLSLRHSTNICAQHKASTVLRSPAAQIISEHVSSDHRWVFWLCVSHWYCR